MERRPEEVQAFGPRALELAVRAVPVPGGGARAFCLDPGALTPEERSALAPGPGIRWQPVALDGGRPAPDQVRLELSGERLTQLPGPLGDELRRAAADLDRPPGTVRLMGVVNVTPDSFSDGGLYLEPERAVEHGLELAAQGAAWLDVGGESTRPGAEPVDERTQIERVLPVVRGLVRSTPVPVSVDTTRAAVAAAALEAGARMVNDVSGGLDDPDLLPLVARAGCEVVLMHRPRRSATMQERPEYEDVVDEVSRALRRRVRAALDAGVDLERIWLDPGIGFGKRLQHNLDLLRRLPELHSLGRPLLLGVSRKAFIAHLTGRERPEDWRSGRRADLPSQRLGGTAAAVAACVHGGAELLRVHDVAVMAEAAAVAAALAGRPFEAGPAAAGEGAP